MPKGSGFQTDQGHSTLQIHTGAVQHSQVTMHEFYVHDLVGREHDASVAPWGAQVGNIRSGPESSHDQNRNQMWTQIKKASIVGPS